MAWACHPSSIIFLWLKKIIAQYGANSWFCSSVHLISSFFWRHETEQTRRSCGTQVGADVWEVKGLLVPFNQENPYLIPREQVTASGLRSGWTNVHRFGFVWLFFCLVGFFRGCVYTFEKVFLMLNVQSLHAVIYKSCCGFFNTLHSCKYRIICFLALQWNSSMYIDRERCRCVHLQ